MPPLPMIMTPSLLAAIRNHPHLPKSAWYIVSGVALSALNRPDEIQTVFRHAISKSINAVETACGHAEQLTVAREMRESLVKSSAICGLPRTINSLFALKQATPPDLMDDPLGFSPTGRPSDIYDVPSSAILLRGKRFFDTIYGKIASRVMGQMDRSGTEDLGLTARLMYGYLLSNERVLSAAQTSFVLLAGLIPQDVNAQLKGHLMGATHHEGVSVEEVKAVREIVIKICEAAGMRALDQECPGGWGWRQNIANL